MNHTISIPDHLWAWGQKHFGVDNPAPDLRMVIAKYAGANPGPFSAAAFTEFTEEERADKPQTAPNNNNRKYDPNTYSDPFPARLDGYCWGSGEKFFAGDLICKKNDRLYLFRWVRENT